VLTAAGPLTLSAVVCCASASLEIIAAKSSDVHTVAHRVIENFDLGNILILLRVK
jgi:hypothetical protein